MTKEDRERELKDINQKRIDLGDLKKKLEAFIGEKENNDANNIPAKNLLTHLCDGLQTFLGFDAASKGYDGSGIVYSDLDRLCDGVMGFLSGVLKDVSEKQPYQVGKTELTELVNLLKTKLSTGRKGFSVIAQVAGKVREYNNLVRDRNNEVKNPIEHLFNYVNKTDELRREIAEIPDEKVFKTYSEKDVEQAVLNAGDLLDKTFNKGNEMERNFNLVEKSVNDLNPSLKLQVNNARKNVKHETDRLQKLAIKFFENMGMINMNIQNMLRKLQENVNFHIKIRVSELVGALRDLVKKIFQKLVEINGLLKGYVDDVAEWITSSKKFIEQKGEKNVNTIMDEVREIASETSNKKSVENMINSISIGLETKVTELQQWKEAGEKVVQEAQSKCDQIANKVNDNGEDKLHKLAEGMKTKAEALRKAAKEVKDSIRSWVQAALTKVKGMDDALKQDLFDIKKQIRKLIWGHVESNIFPTFNTLDDDVITDVDGLKTKIIRDMKMYFTEYVSKVKEQVGLIKDGNSKTNDSDGLDGIKTKVVTEWAKGFKNEKQFEGTVQRWVENILKENEMVKKRLRKWIEINRDGGGELTHDYKQADRTGNHTALNVKISNVFMDQLKTALDSQIWENPQQMSNAVPGSIEYDVQYVRKVCERFSERLGVEINKREIHHTDHVVDKIITGINSNTGKMEGVFNSKPTRDYNIDLAVAYTLTALSSTAKSFGDELHKLALTHMPPTTHSSRANLAANLDKALDVARKLESDLTQAVGDSGGVPGIAHVTGTVINLADTIDGKIAAGVESHIAGKKADSTMKLNNNGLMSTFKGAYDILQAKFQQVQIEKEVDEMLNQQIGRDDGAKSLTGFASQVLREYTRHIKQDDASLSALMKGIIEGSDEENILPKAIGAINTHVTSAIKGSKNEIDAIIEASEASFVTPFRKITEQLQLIAELIDYNKKKQKPFDGKPNGVKNYLLDLTRMIDVNDEYLLTSDVKVPHEKVNGVMAIKTELHDLNTISIAELKKNLRSLCDAIRTAANNAHWCLNDLKNDRINANLEAIRETLHSLRIVQLTEVITLANNLISTEATKLEDDTVKKLRTYVDKEIEYALSTLTTAARRNYVTSVKQLLTAFADKVEKELQGLPGEIERDLTIGFKGLMRKVQGEFKDDNLNSENIQNLVNQKDNSNVEKLSGAFQQFWKPLKNYLITEIQRVNTENNSKKNPVGTDRQYYTHTLLKINDSLADLLEHLGKQNRYDHKLHGLLQKLISAKNELKPDNFAMTNTPVLDGIGCGLSRFVDELRKVYISTYDSVSFDGVLFDNHRSEVTPQKAVSTYDLSGYGKKCAKVFLTTLEMLSNDFYTFIKESMKSWKARQINTYNDNLFGKWLEDRGYKVNREKGKQTGELQNKETMTTTTIYDILNTNGVASDKLKMLVPWKTQMIREERATNQNPNQINLVDAILFLYEQVQIYYKVSHYNVPLKPKAPSSVKDMLQWLIGLPHTTVYNELTVGGFGELFEKPEEEKLTDESGPTLKMEDDDKLEAYPATITAVNLRDTLTEVCHDSYDVLVSLVGHGHSGGRYACDFNTNEDKFSYPNDMNALTCTMLDILTRLHEQLYFLCRQCHYTTDLSGWANCWYGRDIGGASWKCNALQCPDQSADQIHNQTCDQKCNQISDCGLKSPLQSFLEDGLQGFLPHQLKVERGALVCTVKHSGMPCKTPMGFGDISQMASHRQQGKHIFATLYKFCGSKSSPLTKLCSQLKCILPSAPKTLNDMFAFYFTLLNDWNETAGTRQMHRENALKKAVIEANFENRNTELDITAMFKHRDHGTKPPSRKSSHITGDLYALVDCHTDSSSVSSHPCGPYLRPICQDRFSTFTAKNADKYVSWIIYSTGSFLEVLKQLYEECNGNCAGDRPKCRVSRCKKGCKALKSPMSPSSAHEKSCGSIVDCKLMRPTIYKYGFVLGDCESLSAESSKRTCKDLCMVLQSVTNEKELSHHPLAELVYRTIPNFLFKIREPFIWLNVALWLLSLLYLLHIMVIRLDLLHIKSHLHSPSSHRIAAQSLLAAARVNKLGRVFYLQP